MKTYHRVLVLFLKSKAMWYYRRDHVPTDCEAAVLQLQL